MKKSLIFQRIINEFRARPLPSLTRRKGELFCRPGKVDALVGMRRSGKTTFMFQAIGDLLGQGQPPESVLYVNFEDDRLLPLETSDLDRVLETFYRLAPSVRQSRAHLFLDEIQTVPGWEAFIRRLVDTENVQVVVSGSSATMLGREIASCLRGRAVTTELFPFDFAEFLAHRNVDGSNAANAGAAQRSLLSHEARAYLELGGFPEAQTDDLRHRLQLLQGYVDTVVLRDVIERHGMATVLPLRRLTSSVLSAPARQFSVNKFYNDLRSQGIKCTKEHLYSCLDHLEDAYLVFAVPIHARSERVRQVNPKKLYTVDPGLANAFTLRDVGDVGPVLENVVFLSLRRSGGTIEYVRTQDGYEVDFVHCDRAGERRLVQACADLALTTTRQRELRALFAAMDELSLDTATIVTLDDEDLVERDGKEVAVTPVWKWLLRPSAAER